MCGSMADIPSASAEIRRGKKEIRKKNKRQDENIYGLPYYIGQTTKQAWCRATQMMSTAVQTAASTQHIIDDKNVGTTVNSRTVQEQLRDVFVDWLPGQPTALWQNATIGCLWKMHLNVGAAWSTEQTPNDNETRHCVLMYLRRPRLRLHISQLAVNCLQITVVI